MNLSKLFLLLVFFISSLWCNAQDKGTLWTSVGVSQDGYGENHTYYTYSGQTLKTGFLAELGYSYKVWKYIGVAGVFRNQFYFHKDIEYANSFGKVDFKGPFRHHTLLVGITGNIPLTPKSAIELRVLTGPFWRITPKVVSTEYRYNGYLYSPGSFTLGKASGFAWAYLFGLGFWTQLSSKVTFMVSLDMQVAHPDFKSVQYGSASQANVYTPAYTYDSKSYSLVFGFGYPL